jgi:hypothetical protein
MGFFSYDLEGQAAIAGQKKSGGGSHWPDKHNSKIPKGVLGLMGFFSYDLEGQAGVAGQKKSGGGSHWPDKHKMNRSERCILPF